MSFPTLPTCLVRIAQAYAGTQAPLCSVVCPSVFLPVSSTLLFSTPLRLAHPPLSPLAPSLTGLSSDPTRSTPKSHFRRRAKRLLGLHTPRPRTISSLLSIISINLPSPVACNHARNHNHHHHSDPRSRIHPLNLIPFPPCYHNHRIIIFSVSHCIRITTSLCLGRRTWPKPHKRTSCAALSSSVCFEFDPVLDLDLDIVLVYCASSDSSDSRHVPAHLSKRTTTLFSLSFPAAPPSSCLFLYISHTAGPWIQQPRLRPNLPPSPPLALRLLYITRLSLSLASTSHVGCFFIGHITSFFVDAPRCGYTA